MKAQSWRTSLLTPLTTIEPDYRRARRLSGQHLFKLPALVDGQVVHLRKPRPKDAVFHHKLHQYATNSTMGSRTDLMRIEPSSLSFSGSATWTVKWKVMPPSGFGV